MSSSADPGTILTEIVARVAALDPKTLPPNVVQLFMTTAIRAYGDLADRGIDFPPLTADADVSATDAVRAASAILKAVDLETFELALWQMFGGSPRGIDVARTGDAP